MTLSHRRIEILQLLANGMTTKEVARELGICNKTVHNHLAQTYKALQVQTVYHAIVKAYKRKLITFPD